VRKGEEQQGEKQVEKVFSRQSLRRGELYLLLGNSALCLCCLPRFDAQAKCYRVNAPPEAQALQRVYSTATGYLFSSRDKPHPFYAYEHSPSPHSDRGTS